MKGLTSDVSLVSFSFSREFEQLIPAKARNTINNNDMPGCLMNISLFYEKKGALS